MRFNLENALRRLLGKYTRNYSSKRILEENFQQKEPFVFIQVGANDGVSFDFLFDFLSKRDAEGIVIEPVKEYFEELVSNFKYTDKVIAVNRAVHPSETEINIYKIKPSAMHKYPDWVKGIASLDADHHLKSNTDKSDIISEVVKAEPFNTIVKQNPLSKKLDYLQIDTEGFDFEVLKMVDFSLIQPSIIKFESVNLSPSDKAKANDLLKRNNYFIFHEFGDTVGINLNEIILS